MLYLRPTMKNKVALITGATSGFGKIILQHLAKSGYDVIVLARNADKIEVLKKELQVQYPSCVLESVSCNLASFSSIVSACEAIKAKWNKIDLMILNAGLWNFKYTETENKIEETLQVNVLSHLLIYSRLKHLIPKNRQSKVIFTASALHQGEINFKDLEFKNQFSGFKAYRQSKLAAILLAKWFAKQEENEGISFFSVHPGVVKTELGRNANWFSKFVFNLMGTSLQHGAKTHLYLIDTDAKSLHSGDYYSKRESVKTTAYSYDMQVAKKLLDQLNNYFDQLKKES